ncbi:MADS-box protein 04g005320-like [Carex rostrata]
MGRNKIYIKKLPKSQRTHTFKKRSEGIKKKAKELSIISDVQVLLLLRTPMGKYHLFQENSSFDGIVQRFLSETPENLADSRANGMKTLRTSLASDIHALDAISVMDHGTGPTHDSQEMQLEQIKMEVSKLESQLGSLRKIDEIEKLEQLDELAMMENSIMELLALNDQQVIQEPPLSVYTSDPGATTNPPDWKAKFQAVAADQYQHQVVEYWEPQQYYPAMANDNEAGPSHC